MQTFETIGDAKLAIMDFAAFHQNELPEDVRQDFRALVSASPVDQIVKTGELLYARHNDCCPEASELAAGLIALATAHEWHGLAEDARGSKIVQALRRDLMLSWPLWILKQEPVPGFSWPEPESDPAPLAQYAKSEAVDDRTEPRAPSSLDPLPGTDSGEGEQRA